LVFVTKYRRGVFTKEVIDDLRGIFAGVCINLEAELMEFDGEHDHVHLLVNYPPMLAVSVLVNSLKNVSSRMIRKKNYHVFAKSCGATHCGRHRIFFQHFVVGAPIAIFVSTSSNSERLDS
jgi:putative transposase